MRKFDEALERTQSWYPNAVKSESHGHTFFIDENEFIMIAYRGKSIKAVIRTKFKNQIALNSYFTTFKEQAQKSIDSNLKRIEILKAENEAQIKPDAIFVSSWGYEQTNVSFYQVVSVKGSKVTLKKITQDRQYDNSDSGSTFAVKDKFIGDPFTLRIGRYGLRIDSVQSLRFWDGKPVYWSSYH